MLQGEGTPYWRWLKPSPRWAGAPSPTTSWTAGRIWVHVESLSDIGLCNWFTLTLFIEGKPGKLPFYLLDKLIIHVVKLTHDLEVAWYNTIKGFQKVIYIFSIWNLWIQFKNLCIFLSFLLVFLIFHNTLDFIHRKGG